MPSPMVGRKFGVGTIPTPDPANVTPASGLVAYRLLNPVGLAPYGLMLVQMTDASTLEIEVFPGSTASAGQFDANSHTFVR